MRNEERKYAEYFINVINRRFGFDYAVFNYNPKETSNYCDIDAKALSKKFLPVLYLQLTKDILEDKGIVKRTKGLVIFDGDDVDNIIRKKEEKYENQRKDYTDTILLVQGDINKNEVKAYDDLFNKLRCDFRNSKFKGIFYVSSGLCEDFKDGVIVSIKNCFGD